MANRLLRDRDASRVGKNWVSNFVKRQPQLKTVFSRKYDYSRTLCENPELIQGWFDLMRNTIAKYGIADADIYNFDETGFIIGQITASMVVISSNRKSKPKLAQPGNRKWATVIQGVNSQG
jgi:RecB family endonuclease NucS